MFLITEYRNLPKKVGFSKKDFIRLTLEFKNFLLEEFEQYLDCIKNEEESVIEKFLNK